MANKETIHGGHRQRLKTRFLKEGLEHFDEHQVLELLLFYCIPRQDTNPIAHALLEHFGSLTQVMEAAPSELQKVKGMGESSAAFLSLLNSFCRYYQISRASSAVILNTLEECGRYLMPFFYGRRNETVYQKFITPYAKAPWARKELQRKSSDWLTEFSGRGII